MRRLTPWAWSITAAWLAAAGVPHQLTEYADMVHDWHVFAGMFPGCGRAIGGLAARCAGPVAGLVELTFEFPVH